MKILIVNVTCTRGSTGAIVTLLKEQLQHDGHDVYVCYGPEYLSSPLPNCFKLTFKGEGHLAGYIGKFFGYYGFGNIYSTLKLKYYIRKLHPDIINLFNIHSTYINDLEVLRYIGKKNIPTVYTMFDEYAYMGRCCFSYECTKFKSFCNNCSHLNDYPRSLFFDRSSYYFKKKKSIYDKSSNITFVGGSFVYGRSKLSALLKSKRVELIEEPIDYDNVYYPRNTDELRKKLNIPSNNIVILTITNYSDVRKGGRFFYDLYDLMKEKSGYSYVFVGYDENIYGRKEGIITIPYVKDKGELAAYYSLADIFVFTSLADTSPNTVQQALGCGSPVCAFDIEGITTMGITDVNVLKLAKTKDIDGLKANVLQLGKKDTATISRCRKSVYDKYNISSIYQKYIDLYKRIIETSGGGQNCVLK